MNEQRRLWLRCAASGVISPLLGVAGCGHAYSKKGTPLMDTRNWQTHCFGRHLLALPPDAKVVDSFTLGGDGIELLSEIKPAQIKYVIDVRERDARAKIKGSRKSPDGNMFIGRNVLSRGGELLYVWEDAYSTRGTVQEAYLVPRNSSRVFKVTKRLFMDEHAAGGVWAERIQQALVERGGDDIPQQTGFCIQGGMLSGSTPVDTEGYKLWITFPDLPRVGLEVDSWQVAKTTKDTLFSRVPAGLAALVNLASGTSVLRKREVVLGQQTAQEMLLRISAEGKRAYHFQLEAVGEANSATQTRLIFEMSTTNIRDEHGHVGDAAFQSDEDAVAFWDALMKSFRVRPGAV